MFKFYMLLIFFIIIGCSSKDKERNISVLPLGGVPDDNFKGVYSDSSFEIPHNPYNGSIITYQWQNVSLAFKEPENYPYGFDRSTNADISPELDTYVYISTLDSELAYFYPKLSFITYNDYQLINSLTKEIYPIKHNEICYLPSGEYFLQGKIYEKWIDIDKHIKIISYKEKLKDIYYVQLNDKEYDTLNNEYSFTKEKISEIFKETYNQVLISAKIIERKPSFYNKDNFDFSKIIQVNMINPNNNVFNFINDIAQNRVLQQIKNNVTNIDPNKLTERHIVIAINQIMKFWPLKSLYGNTEDLALLMSYKFNPEKEPIETTYAIQSIGTCEDGVGENGIGVSIRKIDLGDNKVHYYAYHNGQKVLFGPCDYLYTTNGLPVIPYTSPNALAVSSTFEKDDFVLGSIVWVPRGIGKSSFYVMMHELGHSFGLTDILSNEKGFASTEKNIMVWQAPSGRKLRYRNQQVVYTSGGNTGKECIIDNVYENQWSCLRDDCDKYEHWNSENPIYKYWHRIGVDKCKENL